MLRGLYDCMKVRSYFGTVLNVRTLLAYHTVPCLQASYPVGVEQRQLGKTGFHESYFRIYTAGYAVKPLLKRRKSMRSLEKI